MEMSRNEPRKEVPQLLDEKTWHQVLRAAVDAQKLIPEAVAAGGTVAALYAGHRFSIDTDHLLMNLRDDFDHVQEILEESPSWRTNRTKPPVLILGSLHGIDVGFRQSRRSLPIERTELDTPGGKLRVPTLDEILGMKAFSVYSRRATRDFLDFAALSAQLSETEVLQTLLRSDERYGELQESSVAFEISKALHEAVPKDLEEIHLEHYKGIQPPWSEWSYIEKICKMYGEKFGEVLILQSGEN